MAKNRTHSEMELSSDVPCEGPEEEMPDISRLNFDNSNASDPTQSWIAKRNARDNFAEKNLGLVIMKVPRTCSPNCIVDFFKSNKTGVPINVLLGTAGIIMFPCRNRVFAFVLFLKKDMEFAVKRSLTSVLHNETVWIHYCGIGELMFFHCGCRKLKDIDQNMIHLKNLPSGMSHEDVIRSLFPYDIWLDAMSPIVPTEGTDTNETICYLTSEFAACFMYMKINRRIVHLDDKLIQLRAYLPHICSVVERDYGFSVLENPEILKNDPPIEVDMQDTQRRELKTPEKWGQVILSNLPFYTTAEDVISIFKGKVRVTERKVVVFPTTPTSVCAKIRFENHEDVKKSVGEMRSFTVAGQVVNVDVRYYTQK